MTHVHLKSNNDIISSVKISGHSGYDVEGYDIVCSAISTAMILTCNILKSFDSKTIVVIDNENTIMEFSLVVFSKEINIVTNQFKYFIESIYYQYPDNIKIIYG